MRLVVIGAGGFAREAIEYIKSTYFLNKYIIEYYSVVGCVVTDLSSLGEHDSKELVLGDYDWLRNNKDKFDGFVIGIGSPKARLKVAAALKAEFPEKSFPNINMSNPKLGLQDRSFADREGIIICPGVIGTVNVSIGNFSLINLSVTIGHEAVIGEGCVINPGANISGGVNIGKGVLVGSGACILQYLHVGDFATVGAGAVVTKQVFDGTTVVGCPAKPLLKVVL
jgi:sugar O-acyltransferase (sialic acid O-acetyltransferase NeuD family)